VSDVPDGGGREVVRGEGAGAVPVLLLRRGPAVWAYRNLCPHFSLPLNYEPQSFHTYDGETVMCAHHSAMFRFEDGFCFDGPCAGASLDPLAIVCRDGRIHLRGG
jgi:nitrite reductase/ring-hydroxylating ferredoxin subunit